MDQLILKIPCQLESTKTNMFTVPKIKFMYYENLSLIIKKMRLEKLRFRPGTDLK